MARQHQIHQNSGTHNPKGRVDLQIERNTLLGGANCWVRQQWRRGHVAPYLPAHEWIFKTLPCFLPPIYALEYAPHLICGKEQDEYYSAYQAVSVGLSTSKLFNDSTAWCQCEIFCEWIQISTYPQGIENPIPPLKISAPRVKSGVLVAQGHPIQKQIMEHLLRSVGKIFMTMGTKLPRLATVVSLYFCLERQL